jgi:type I restriction enzyme R subunit
MTAPPPGSGEYPEPGHSLLEGFSEAALVEEPAVELFAALGWETANLHDETFGPGGTEGRESRREVFLPRRLRAALERLNPGLPADAIETAIAELTRDRSAMNPVAANREVHLLLRDGVKANVRGADGETRPEIVRLVDWREPARNDFFLARQFWVAGELWTRRADLVGFVNGIPLVLAELKAITKPLAAAYEENLRDYRDTIPHLFHPNGFVILSNGAEAVMGASHGAFDHFAAWKRIEDEAEKPLLSLETLIRATCGKERLLDIVENFIVFEEARGGFEKKVAKNHQFLGVNKAVAALRERSGNAGRLGVFWHTQGSGKSLSMVYFAEKVHRTVPGNWTFVIVTDRQELDEQIAGTFARTGALAKELNEVQAQSREHLKRLLAGDERYVFTLIQKFSGPAGELYPKLSDRSDIVVITDEAHRSQYDQLAANMRRALPNAAFIGFTGTPLMAGEEKTREVFGDYLSVYNFAQSIEDGATVPLYYEKRIPEIHVVNEDFEEELQEILEKAELDDDQQRLLERRFARQYQLITRDDRLDKIASDLVRHFAGRGYRGKAMFVAIDKATAVRMYDKVRARWAALLAEEAARVAAAPPEERPALEEKLKWLHETDMAVVVSQSQNEVADMKAKGLDIRPHRARMVKEDLDEKFKDPADPLRLVFVCAMWITGFDVPTCSTMYIDKPMKNHTLMQTIARANRRAEGKAAGLIVDYVGVFASLQRALAIYARPSEGADGDRPIRDKGALLAELGAALDEAKAFCGLHGVDPDAVWRAEKFDRAKAVADAVERLIAPDSRRDGFLSRVGAIVRLYKAILPDERAGDFTRDVAALHVIAERMRATLKKPDLSAVTSEIEALLDRSIGGIEITAPIRADGDTAGLFDLSAIDFEKLAKAFAKAPKTTTETLRAEAERKARALASMNPTRAGLIEKLEKLIDAYNAGSVTVETLFAELVKFIEELGEEERRAAREELSEEELAIFDLLTKPDPKLTRSEEIEAKKIARTLLERLKREKFVFEWRQKQQTRAAVRQAIEEELDRLPPAYEKPLWDRKVELVYQFVYERFPGAADGAGFAS